MSRVTMFVYSEAHFDSRVRREASTLAADGHEVTLVTLAPPRMDSQEFPGHDGSFAVLRAPDLRPWSRGQRRWMDLRDRPWRLARRELQRGGARRSGRESTDRPREGRPAWKRWAAVAALLPWMAVRAGRSLLPIRGRKVGMGHYSGIRYLVDWHDRVVGWAVAAARLAPASDVFHGHDLDGLTAAIAAQRHHGGGTIVYDCHDLQLVAAGRLLRPWWSRWVMARMQDRWISKVDRCLTVSAPMGRELARLGTPEPIVVRNCPVRWSPGPDHVSPLRAAIGVGPEVPIVIYHGGLMPNRGIDKLLTCIDMPGLEDARLVFLGFGGLWDEVAAAAARHPRVDLLPAVPPSELLSWLSGADVGAAVCGDSPNHRVTIPNKVFEGIAAGVPMVVSDFEPWRAVVEDDPTGPLGRAVDPVDLTAVTTALVELISEVRHDASLRERCRTAALERLNWETESQGLLDLYRELARQGGDGA